MAYEFGPGEYELENGWKGRVYDIIGDELIGIKFESEAEGAWSYARWSLDGSTRQYSPHFRLLPPKQARTGWINIYSHGIGAFHTEKKSCDVFTDRIACKEITIEFVPGEGLGE